MIYLDIVLAQKGLGFIGYFGKSTLDILDTWGQLQIKLEKQRLVVCSRKILTRRSVQHRIDRYFFLRVEVIARSFSCIVLMVSIVSVCTRHESSLVMMGRPSEDLSSSVLSHRSSLTLLTRQQTTADYCVVVGFLWTQRSWLWSTGTNGVLESQGAIFNTIMLLVL